MKVHYKNPIGPIVTVVVAVTLFCLGASALKNVQTASTLTAGKVLTGNGNSTATPAANLTWTPGNNTLTVGPSGAGNITANVINGNSLTVSNLTVTDMALTNALPVTSGGTGRGTSFTLNSPILGNTTGAVIQAAGITTDGANIVILGQNATATGGVKMFGSTSGNITISAAAAAGSGTINVSSTGSNTFQLNMGTTTANISGGFIANVVIPANVTLTEPEIDSYIGFRDIPQNAQTGNYTLTVNDLGKHIYHAAGAAAATWTIPANATISRIGGTVTFFNASANNVTIAITTDTLNWYQGNITAGSRTLVTGAAATAVKTTASEWVITGTGIQ